MFQADLAAERIFKTNHRDTEAQRRKHEVKKAATMIERQALDV
jgi:hypothetical protein